MEDKDTIRPHHKDLGTCRSTATGFHSRHRGIVSTVTCPRQDDQPTLKEFDQIARAGGGESYLSADSSRIVNELLVLVFGSKHRDNVRNLLGP